jgi:hypothetical protein
MNFLGREVLNIMGDTTQELQKNNMSCFLKRKKKNYNSLFYWKSWMVVGCKQGWRYILTIFLFQFS